MVKINADLSNPFINHVAEVKYDNSKFEIEFNEEINIKLNNSQFENLFVQMFDTYIAINGENAALNLIENIKALEVV